MTFELTFWQLTKQKQIDSKKKKEDDKFKWIAVVGCMKSQDEATAGRLALFFWFTNWIPSSAIVYIGG